MPITSPKQPIPIQSHSSLPPVVKIYFNLKISLWLPYLFPSHVKLTYSFVQKQPTITALLTLEKVRSKHQLHTFPFCFQHHFIWALANTRSTNLNCIMCGLMRRFMLLRCIILSINLCIIGDRCRCFVMAAGGLHMYVVWGML
jgi:hypothetical protein